MDFHISCRVLLMRWVVNRLRWRRMDFNCLKGSVKILFNLGEFGIFNSSQTLRQILCKHLRFDCKLTQKVNIHPEKATKVTFTWTMSRQLWRILSLHPTPTSHAFRLCRLNTVCLQISNSACLFACNTGDYKVMELWYRCILLAKMISYVFFSQQNLGDISYLQNSRIDSPKKKSEMFPSLSLVFHAWTPIWENYSNQTANWWFGRESPPKSPKHSGLGIILPVCILDLP